MDEILEQLSVFWANTEVVLDLLTKKGQHVEQFIGFASKPRLMARFRERMEEYKRFWENVSMMCSNYIAGVQTTNDTQRMYGFLEAEAMTSSVSTMSTLSSPPMGAGKSGGAGVGGGVGSAGGAGSGQKAYATATAASTRNGPGNGGVSGVGGAVGLNLNFSSPVRN